MTLDSQNATETEPRPIPCPTAPPAENETGQPSIAGKATERPAISDGPKGMELLRAWVQASRPQFYVATAVPLTLGMVAALRLDGIWRPWLFLLVLLASFLVHAATNLLNDYFDHDLGVDSKESIGGSRVIQEGKISPGSIRAASFLLYLSAFLLAIAIVGRYRALWGMVVFAALSSFFYVAPPIKYGHRALGELFVFLNMGLVMCLGTYMALTGKYSPQPVAMSLPVALMVAGILYFQSLPEIETDKAAGKLTLAGLLGKERSALVFLLWWPLVWLLMATLYFSGLAAWPALLGPLALPFHITACRRIKAAKDWLELDASGHLVRKEYFLNGLCLIVGVAMGPFPPVA